MTKQTWQERKVALGSAIVAGACALVVGFFLGGYKDTLFSNFAPYLGFKSPSVSKSLDWSSLDEVYYALARNYDGELDDSALIEGAKKGLTEAVGDVYTAYMTKEESASYQDTLHGKVGAGIGVEMAVRDGYVRVLRTLPDNPARKAGILAGDILYKVDGEEVWNLTSDEVASRIRGESGTTVKVTVVRDGVEKEFSLVREEINNVSADVEYRDKTAIVKITRFDTDTGQLVQSFAKDFAGKGITKVIIDLRGNGGGYVSAARDLLSLWIDGEPILVQKSLHSVSSTTTAYSGRDILKDTKTIVLVNGSTASASEIVAGALKDYGKATIIGETTYGKGVVQTLYDLSNSTLLKVTTAHWYTPNGTTINGTGVTPDKIVERTYDDINHDRDPQLDAALEY